MSSKHTLYTCEIIFHRATHVPIGDLNDLSCDPYIRASLEVPNVHPEHPNPPLSYRTPTIRHSLNPTYNARWIVSGIPDTGFTLTLRLMDEDPGNHDDRLGKTILHLPRPESGKKLKEGWDTGEIEYKVEKKKGSMRAHVATYLATMVTRGAVSHHARIWVSVRVLGEATNQKDRRVFTIGPPKYVQHFSPLIGHLVSGGTATNKYKGKGDKTLSTSTFVANRLQLHGPPPRSLQHRYVGYAPFIKSLFKKSGVRGKILNYALHRQYHTVYSYDKNTVYGVAGEGDFDTDGKRHAKEEAAQKHGKAENGHANEEDGHETHSSMQPTPDTSGGAKQEQTSDDAPNHSQPQPQPQPQPHPDALARQFLRMTSHGSAGRLFTYVITLDSEWRFTETGAEFSVDLLSKHSMHANVAKEIAFSGEFFVRRVLREGENQEQEETDDGVDSQQVSDNLKDYEIVIDNDSGTYRPKKELLPKLEKWLAREENLGALGKVTAMDGFDETLKKWKEQRQEEKRKAKGLKPRPKDGDDKGKEKEGEEGEEGEDSGATGELGKMAMPKRKGSSVSSISSGKLGSGAGSLSSSDVEDVIKEDAKRARENEDDDQSARSEERREAPEEGDGGKGKEKEVT